MSEQLVLPNSFSMTWTHCTPFFSTAFFSYVQSSSIFSILPNPALLPVLLPFMKFHQVRSCVSTHWPIFHFLGHTEGWNHCVNGPLTLLLQKETWPCFSVAVSCPGSTEKFIRVFRMLFVWKKWVLIFESLYMGPIAIHFIYVVLCVQKKFFWILADHFQGCHLLIRIFYT